MSQKVSIIALGWLGAAVYDSFSRIFECSGSYYSNPKGKEREYYFDINEYSEIPNEILSADILFINLPPSKIEDIEKLRGLLRQLKTKRVILISSTSVYEQGEYVDEDSRLMKESTRAKKQLKIEDVVRSEVKNHLILRCAGLYSDDRHPGFYLSGKNDISGANSPVNLVSKKDILKTLNEILVKSDQKIINLVNINHPKKKEYYNNFCEVHKIDKIKFNNKAGTQKIVGTKYPQFKIESELP